MYEKYKNKATASRKGIITCFGGIWDTITFQRSAQKRRERGTIKGEEKEAS
jgi:hypothetical protein